MTLDHPRALDALYVDFEGIRGAAPALVGVLHGEVFETTVLDARLLPAARGLGLPVRTLEDWLAKLLRHAERLDLPVVAYSPHEDEMVAAHAPEQAAAWAARAVNAQPLVRSWARRNGHAVPRGERGLKAFAALHAIDYPPGLVAESVPLRLRAVAAACRRHDDWEDAPLEARRRWRALLDYNRLDCLALRALAVAALRGSVPAVDRSAVAPPPMRAPITLK